MDLTSAPPGAATPAGELPRGVRVGYALGPKLLELGFEIVANTPEQFTAFQANEYARWKKVIEAANIKMD